MKTGRKIIIVLAVFLLVIPAAFGNGDESTRNVRETNKENIEAIKENIEAIKAESRAIHEKAATPSPALARFRDAKGFREKVEAIVAGIVEGARENSEKERARRAEIQSRNSYRKIINKQINGSE